MPLKSRIIVFTLSIIWFGITVGQVKSRRARASVGQHSTESLARKRTNISVQSEDQTGTVISVSENRYQIIVRMDSLSWRSDRVQDNQIFPQSPDFLPYFQDNSPVVLQKTYLIALPDGRLPKMSVQIGTQNYVTPPSSPQAFHDIPEGLPTHTANASTPNENFPEQLVKIERIGKMQGVELAKIRVCPLQYIAATHQYLWTKRIRITLNFDADYSTPNIGSLNRSMVQKLVMNPQLAASANVSEKRTVASSRTPAVPSAYDFATELEIPHNGIYKITASELRDSTGSEGTISPNSLRLFHQGREEFLNVYSSSTENFVGDDYLEFIVDLPDHNPFGRQLSVYNSTAKYWLVWGGEKGKRYANFPAAPVEQSPYYLHSFRDTINVGDKNHFERLAEISTGKMSDLQDHWFLSNRLTTGESADFTFFALNPDVASPNPIGLTIAFQGLSAGEAGSHRADIWLDDQHLDQTSIFQNMDSYIYHSSAEFPAQNLQSGENNLRVTVNRVQNDHEALSFNWFEVSYDRLFQAQNDFLEFPSPSDIDFDQIYEYDVSGFSSSGITVFRSDGLRIFGLEVEPDPDNQQYRVRFQQQFVRPNIRFYVVSDSGVSKPTRIQTVNMESEPFSMQNHDYLIITPEKFKDLAEEWKNYRNSTGWNAEVITLKSIYARYSAGYGSPRAIRDFLRDQYWSFPPDRVLHALLLGDSGFRNHKPLPMPMFQAYQYGAAGTDYFYTNLDTTDLLPEIALGRLPVESVDELGHVFDKIRNYESNASFGSWHNTSLFIAGNAPVFEDQTESLIQYQVDQSTFPKRLFTDPASEQSPYFGGTPALLGLLDAGLLHVNFMGHGGGAVWADQSLFLNENIDDLNNAKRLPFVTSLTCFTGAIASTDPLGERMLTDYPSGAIGWFGSSGLGWIWNDYLIGYDFPKYVYEPDLTLGEIVNAARIGYIARAPNYHYSYLVYTMLHQYNLLGDPGMHLQVPQHGSSIHLSKSNLTSGESLRLTTSNSQPTDLQIYNETNEPVINSGLVTVHWSQENTDLIALPESFAAAQGHIAWLQQDTISGNVSHGSIPFAMNSPLFVHLRTIPDLPQSNEDIYFATNILSRDSITNIEVHTSVTLNPIPMTKVNNNLWETTEPLQGLSSGTQVIWYISGNLEDGTEIQSPSKQVQISALPDLSLESIDDHGGNLPTIDLIVKSTNLVKGDQPVVNIWLVAATGDTLAQSQQSLNFRNTLRDTISVQFYNPGRLLHLNYSIDPSNQIAEDDEENNTGSEDIRCSWFAVLPQTGLTFHGSQPDTLVFEEEEVWIDPGAVQSRRTIQIHQVPILQNLGSFGMELSQQTSTQLQALEINTESSVTSTIPVMVLYHQVLSDSDYVWYRSPPDKLVWAYYHKIQQPTVLSKPGRYVVARTNDHRGPLLSVTINDGQYLPDMYVNTTPLIHFIAEDCTGVDSRINNLDLQIDGSTVELQNMQLVVTGLFAKTQHIQFSPELSHGSHTLKFKVKDIHRNWSEPFVLSLLVDEEQKVIDYGNFPNPFQTATDFYYELSGEAESLELQIFTIDGRMLQKFSTKDYPGMTKYTKPGFHQFHWDGTDRYGASVANGVYFYYLKVRINNKTITSKGKIAKTQ